uniref:Uncharacterized protein n=1 Tax=Amphimedon queenslandica TaxID=400682 RepID=A0A1X7V878_AMPQE
MSLRDNRTPLHVAVECKRIDAVQWLLDKGANLELRDIAGATPLIYAAYNGHIQVVAVLLEKGADVVASDNPMIRGGMNVNSNILFTKMNDCSNVYTMEEAANP